jgi:act minimal PKS acyl carrier protein
MSAFGIDELLRILREAGGDDSADLTGDALDTTFGDLGYDSLVLLELTACIRRSYGVTVEDEQAGSDTTPGKLIAHVNDLLQQVTA